MKQPFFSRPRALSRQRGVTMVLVALAMVAIIAMAAISIDVITLYLAREEAQRAADTAALAAARVISLSGITGDPGNAASSWQAICGASSSPATQAATAVALQNMVGGAAANNVNVTYGSSAVTDCSTLISGSASTFSVNPTVTVQVQRTNLPNFFSRIWSRSGTNLSATATAEVFNSSFSSTVGTSGDVVPVQPACVKPWFVPNYDPLSPANCTKNCTNFIDPTNGNIKNPGISLNGGNAGGVVGESFALAANCTHTGTGCNFRATPIQANLTGNTFVNNGITPNLLYYPGQAPTTTPTAVPAACSAGGSGGSLNYEPAIAGCDQSTPYLYQCGVSLAGTIDLSENPSLQNGDTAAGVQCLIHQGNTGGPQPDGQDVLVDSAFPFQIQAGSSNPLVTAGLPRDTQISASNSIVSLPIYDAANTVSGSGTSKVTVVGFLQVFISKVDQWDNMQVTVLNVTGCGNGSGTTVGSNPVAGTSPVPIRLITPQ